MPASQERVKVDTSRDATKSVPYLLSLLLVVAGLSSQAQSPAALSDADRSRAAAQALMALYDRETGLFHTTGWWNSANAVTALADESRATGDARAVELFPDILLRAPHKYPTFLNDFYDDEGWWALAWIDVYELNPKARGAKQYFETASSIFNDMAGGWDDTCSGGIWWSKERKYKNAIANELFLSVAAKLALHAHGKHRRQYLSWADPGVALVSGVRHDQRRFAGKRWSRWPVQEQPEDHVELQPGRGVGRPRGAKQEQERSSIARSRAADRSFSNHAPYRPAGHSS